MAEESAAIDKSEAEGLPDWGSIWVRDGEYRRASAAEHRLVTHRRVRVTLWYERFGVAGAIKTTSDEWKAWAAKAECVYTPDDTAPLGARSEVDG